MTRIVKYPLNKLKGSMKRIRKYPLKELKVRNLGRYRFKISKQRILHWIITNWSIEEAR
jgi:hypothetical protein